MATIVITGANGFIGSHLCNVLTDRGDKVIAVGLGEKPDSIKGSPNLQYFNLDANHIDDLNLNSGSDIMCADAFVHLAWAGISGPNRANVNLQIQNIEMTTKCFEFANFMCCKKFIFAGTIQEAEIDNVKDNLSLISPSLIYGASKKYAHYLCNFLPKDDMKVCVLRITNIYGPGENSPRFINTTIRKLLNKEPLQFSAATQNYDFIYIDDAVAAIVAVIDKGLDNKQYVIGSGHIQPLKNFIYDLVDVVDATATPNFSSNEGINLPVEEFDITNLIEDTGFTVKTTFKEGIQKTTDWIKENL